MGDNEDQLGVPPSGDVSGDADKITKCRKSKRVRTVPPQLLTDYQCDTSIRNRASEGPTFGNGGYDLSEIQEKYKRLKVLLNQDWYAS